MSTQREEVEKHLEKAAESISWKYSLGQIILAIRALIPREAQPTGVTCPKCGNYYAGHATGAGDICTCPREAEPPITFSCPTLKSFNIPPPVPDFGGRAATITVEDARRVLAEAMKDKGPDGLWAKTVRKTCMAILEGNGRSIIDDECIRRAEIIVAKLFEP